MIGFASAWSGNIYKTIDGGNSWSEYNIVGTGWETQNILFEDSQIGYMTESTGNLLRTTNGGQSWTSSILPLFSGTTSSIPVEIDLKLINGILYASYGSILASSIDKGITWRVIANLNTGGINWNQYCAFDITSNNNIWLSGLNGLYKTTTGGTSNLIDLQTLSQTSYCAGSILSLPYNITGVYGANNNFTAQLSNSMGSFASPTTLQTFSSVGNGTLAASLPSNTAAGSGYKIRVLASSPAVVSDTSAAFSITTAVAASVTVATANAGICAGQSATFTATPSNGGTAPVLTWKLNGATVGNNAATYTTAALQNGDAVWVEMQSNAACANSTPVASVPIAVTITTVDVPFIQAIDNILAASTDIGVQWYLNGVAISGATSQFYTATQNGFYQVKVTINGCIAQSTLFQYIQVATENVPSNAIAVRVFPNPTTGNFTIEIDATEHPVLPSRRYEKKRSGSFTVQWFPPKISATPMRRNRICASA